MSPPGVSKAEAKEVVQEIVKIFEAEAAEVGAPKDVFLRISLVNSFIAIPVILRPLVGIGENGIGFGNLLELLGCRRILIAIGVICQRKFSIG